MYLYKKFKIKVTPIYIDFKISKSKSSREMLDVFFSLTYINSILIKVDTVFLA